MNNKEAIKLISNLHHEVTSKFMNSAEILLAEALEKAIKSLQKEDEKEENGVKSISVIDNPAFFKSSSKVELLV